MAQGTYQRFLGHIPAFKGFTEADLAELARLFKTKRVAAGADICREGEAGDGFFIVTTGEVVVLKATAQGDLQQLAELPAPTVVGEMALLDRAPRSATVRAKTGCELYRIDGADFDVLRAQWNRAAYKLIHNLGLVLCERLRDTNEKINTFFANPERSLAELRARQQQLFRDREAQRKL